MWNKLDVGFWIGILLAIPLSVASNLLSRPLFAYLDRRKLIKANRTRQQALDMYRRISAFRAGTRDRFPYYILLGIWAVVCAIIGSTLLLLALLVHTETPFPFLTLTLLALFFLLLTIGILMGLYETSRRLDNFDAYKAEFEAQWGSVPDEA
jgi:hypothetical protein